MLHEKHPAGAEARVDIAAFAARLKSCPVTKPWQIAFDWSFSAACKALIDLIGWARGINPRRTVRASFSAACVSLPPIQFPVGTLQQSPASAGSLLPASS